MYCGRKEKEEKKMVFIRRYAHAQVSWKYRCFNISLLGTLEGLVIHVGYRVEIDSSVLTFDQQLTKQLNIQGFIGLQYRMVFNSELQNSSCSNFPFFSEHF